MADESPPTPPDDDAAAAADEDAPRIVVANTVYPPTLPIIPLPSRPMFPKTVAPLLVTASAHIALVKEALSSQAPLVGLALARGGEAGEAETKGDAPQSVRGDGPVDLHEFGVIAQLLKAQGNDGQLQVLAGGLDRIRLASVLTRDPHVVAKVDYLHEPKVEANEALRAYALAVINSCKDLVKLNPLFKQELTLLIQQGSVEEPGRLADYAAYLTSAKGRDLQRVLETLDVRERLELVLELLRREIAISELQAQIRSQIEERVGKQQREFFLREQLKAIKQELGLERDDKEAELERFASRLEEKTLTEEAQTRVDDQLDRLRSIDPASPEYSITRNYVDLLTDLPWGIGTDADVSLAGARRELERSHYGLDDVKARIVEHIAAGLLKGTFSGSILLLVGPPGVGKTSIGKSIARALGRPFYRFSLGGMRDEAEIKGHRRTYIGAMPGKFIQALRLTGAHDPVIMLDEIDKIGASFRGDPASALLEALDPEQNAEFLDHYLDVRFDLSNVLFVCTANQLDTIPGPLLDRMETIKLSGYLLAEKLNIAKTYLVPRQLAAHGLDKRQLRLTKPTLRALVEGYARDPGVRTLEKSIKRIVRKSAVRLLESEDDDLRIDVKPADLRSLLGRPVFRNDTAATKPRPGVVMGLAWTSMGGDTLMIEATAIQTGKGGLKQTGQLGKVMVESSEIAFTHARQLVDAHPTAHDFFTERFIHLHVPAGATPKDGPSAGITMCLALYTLATGVPVARGFAMTGELNLSGQVLPVGGIREKLLAARRARVKQVILPEANQGDVEDLPEHVTDKLRIHFASKFSEVLALALG
ncbi:MAG: endopeptidase La [Myxococcota bacterium]